MPFKIPFTNLVINKEERKSVRPYAMKKSGFISRVGERPDFSFFFYAYEKNSDVGPCVRELAQGVFASGVRFCMADDPDEDVPDTVKNELTQIFNYRKADGTVQTFQQLKFRTVRDLSITGNAYWYLVRNTFGNKVLGFTPLDPRTFSIVSDAHGTVKAYIQRVGMKTVTFSPEEIVHFKEGDDTQNETFGMSPMMGVDVDIKADIEAAITNLKVMENDAIPAAVYILKDDLSGNELDAAIEAIKKSFKGSENSGKSTVMPDIKDIKLFERDFSKLQFIDLRKFTTEKVCAAFGVPKFLLGYTEAVNNNNGIQLQKQFYTGTIQPKETCFEDVVNYQVLPRLGGEKYAMKAVQQVFDQEGIEKRALEELRMGAITLRQYKVKTGQEITPEDEDNPNFDAYIIHQAAGSRLLEDVGVEPVVDVNDPDKAENFVKALEVA